MKTIVMLLAAAAVLAPPAGAQVLDLRRAEHRADPEARPRADGGGHAGRDPRGARPVPAVVHRRLRRGAAGRATWRRRSRRGRAGPRSCIRPSRSGQGGANVIGGKHSFPGSYNVRSETLRAVYMDLADAFGAQGFRWILVVDDHGSPNHNRALTTPPTTSPTPTAA